MKSTGSREVAPSRARCASCRPHWPGHPAFHPHLGSDHGDAHASATRAGVTDDSLRSLLVSRYLPGAQEIMVINHTDCGLMSHQRAGAAEPHPGPHARDRSHRSRILFCLSELRVNVLSPTTETAYPSLGFPKRSVWGTVYDVVTAACANEIIDNQGIGLKCFVVFRHIVAMAVLNVQPAMAPSVFEGF